MNRKVLLYLLLSCTVFSLLIFTLPGEAAPVNTDSLLQVIHRTQNNALKEALYDVLIENYYETDLKQTIHYSRERVHFNMQAGDTLRTLRAYSRLINYLMLNVGDFERVTQCNDTMRQLALAIKDNYYLAGTYFIDGTLSLYTGQYIKALESFYKALPLAESDTLSDNYLSMTAVIYTNLAITLQTISYKENQHSTIINDTAKAETKNKSIAYYRQSLHLHNRMDNKQEQVVALLNIGITHYSFGDPDSSIYYFQESLKLALAINDESKAAVIYMQISNFYQHVAKNNSSAAHYIRKAIAIQERRQEHINLASSYHNLADLYLNAFQQYDSCLKYNSLALEVYEKLNALNGQSESLKGIYLAYEAKHDYKNALKYYQQYVQKEKEVFSEEKSRILSELQTKYETQKKENKIIQLAKNNLIQEKRNKQFQAAMYGLSTITILCVAILIIYRLQINTNKKKDIIARQELEARLQAEELNSIHAVLESREEERKRIAGELHDRLGIMLSAAGIYTDMLPPADNSNAAVKLRQLINDAAEETRRVTQALCSPVLQRLGIAAALRELADQLNDTGRINVITDIADIENISTDQAQHIFGILQELTNNTLKHATDARTIHIRIYTTPDRYIHISYTDDGNGFRKELFNQNCGTGYKSILSRTTAMNGSITYPDVEKGMRIKIEIPPATTAENTLIR